MLHLLQRRTPVPNIDDSRKTALKLIVCPTLCAAILFYFLYVHHLDMAIAQALYNVEGHQWSLAHNWFFSDVMHNGTRIINNLLIANILGFWLYQKLQKNNTMARRHAFNKLIVSVLISYLIVALFKRLLPAECPWDLIQFGGKNAFISIFQPYPSQGHRNLCFPAGHASIGYAWLALYFYWLPVSQRKAFYGLWIGMLAGLALGIAQQLRGAHFLSHDVVTAWLCWIVACGVYFLWPTSKHSENQVVLTSNSEMQNA